MKVHEEKKELTLTVTLNKEEIVWLKDYTQNFCGSEDDLESEEESTIRKHFFITMMVALGYKMQPDGSMIRK